MAVTRIACPNCKRVLKSSTGLPVGKKVQCPGCKSAFVVQDEEKSGVQAKAPVGPRRKTMSRTDDDDMDDARPQRKARYQDEDDDIPRKRRSRRDEEDEDDDDRPRRRSRHDEDDEEDDERPRRRSRRDDDEDDRPQRKGKKNKGGNRTLVVALVAGSVGLLLVVFVLTAFVWPGFLRSPAAVVGPNDPMVFMPADCDVVAGLNLAPLRGHPDYKKAMDKFFESNPQMLPIQKDLLGDVDAAFIGGKGGGLNSQGAIVAVMNKPQDSEKIRLAFVAGPPEQIQGKTVFRTKTGEVVSMPTNKMVVVAKMPDVDVASLLARTKPAFNPEIQTQVARLRSSTMWVVGSLDGEPRRKLQEIQPQQLKMLPIPGLDGLGDFLTTLQKGKLGTASADMPADGKSLKMEVGLVCANGDDAKKGAASLTKVWDTSGKALLGMAQFGLAMQAPEVAGINGLLNDVTQSLKFQAGGDLITASVTFSEATIKELEKDANKLPINANPKIPTKKKVR